jgi:amino acid transporter
LERIGQRLGVKDPNHPLLNQAEGQTLVERIEGDPRGTLVERTEGDPRQVLVEKREKRRREKILNEERGKIVTALRGARSAALREQLRIRSFSIVLGATIAAMIVLAIAVAIMGYRSPTAVPLCFAPEEAGQPTEVVCPTAHSAPIPDDKPVSGQVLDHAIQQAVRKSDLLLVEVLGLTAAAVAAAVAIRGIRGSSEALHLPVLLALLKLPMGAITAFLGLLLMRGQFVPGLSALDTSAQILAWALVFGYAQQLFTRFVDQQGQTVLDSVRAADKREPSPSPP